MLMVDQQGHADALEEREQFLRHCMDQLTSGQRDLLDCYYYTAIITKEYSVGRISELSGRTVDAIDKSLQRIRRLLHDCIEHKIQGAGA